MQQDKTNSNLIQLRSSIHNGGRFWLFSKEDIEARRHEYMLSVIKDRIDNTKNIHSSMVSKYS
jgi:hypothetical protein